MSPREAEGETALVLAAECAPSSAGPPPRRRRARGEQQSGHMKCQCKLVCEVDGEWVHVCNGFNIKPAQRSVSFVGFPYEAIMKMLVALGYDFRIDAQLAEARQIADALSTGAPGAGSTYRFNVFHFSPNFLSWTPCMVKWSTEMRMFESIWPNIPADLVRYRTQLYVAAHADDPQGTSTKPFALVVRPASLARAPPAERGLRASARDLDTLHRQLAGRQLGKRPTRTPSWTPSSAQPPEKTVRSDRDLDALQRLGARMAESFDAVADAVAERDAAARFAAEADRLRVAAQADAASCAAAAAAQAAERAAAAAARDQLLRDLAQRERELVEQGRMLNAERVTRAHLEKAAKGAKLPRWCTAMLAPGGALVKLCAQLTTFTSLENFLLWYDVVCDGQGWADPTLAGKAARLDHFYAPKHIPQLEIGQPEPEPLDAAAARAAADKRWKQQLNQEKPGGLASPLEACFMTMTMMRLGLTVAEVSVLFGISTGSVSQIFHTWLPYLHKCMKVWTPWPGRELVRANLPKKFTTQLAQVTHSKDCHVIFDCTEIEVDIPEDEYLKKLFYSSYKKYHTLKFLVAITPCGRLAFVSDGYPGSFSDDEIVRASGFLDLLEPGMAVMSDRGYDNFPALRQRGVELIIPSLSHTMGKGAGHERAPFTEAECLRTYRIANVRIHVERMMRSIKASWRSFHTSIPVVRIPDVSKYMFSLAAMMTAWQSPLVGVDYLD